MSKSKSIHAAFVCLDLESASSRVRMLDHQGGLAELGVASSLHALPKGPLARRKLFRTLKADVVVLQRVLLGELDLVSLRSFASAVVLDLDDAIYERPHGATAGSRLRAKFEDTVKACDLVVCGNLHLRDELRSRHPRVRLLPPASPQTGLPDREDHEGAVRLVWTGSLATLPYLARLAPVLASFGDEIELEVVADARPNLPGEIPVRFTPWSHEAEAEALARADVGLYPLDDDSWSQGKCAYKLHRYMQFGLPSIASPHGAGREVLSPPEAGLIAETPAEWEAALRKLIRDSDLRRRMGRRARALALAQHALPDRTRTLERILREAAAIGRLRGHSG